MEEIKHSDIDENLIYLSNIKIEDMFPKTPLYPGQKYDFGLNLSDMSIDSDNGGNNLPKPNKNNSNNLSIDASSLKLCGIKSKLYKNTTLDSFFNSQPKEKNNSNSTFYNNESVSTPTNYKFSKKIQTINFSSSYDHTVYDVFIKGDLIIGCGGPYVKIYNLKNIKNNSSEALITFCDDKDEYFYAVNYSIIEKRHLIAVGGKKSIIRILDLDEECEWKQLIGHRNEIYDLKFNPTNENSQFLLSASKDFSVRLWDVLNSNQICIFAGPEGHSAEVLSIDWHPSGDYFVSSSIDYFVKIWHLDENINKQIEKSKTIKTKEQKRKEKFKTIIKTYNIFSCNTLHDNYVDCVKFNENFILSKSVDGVIKEWFPVFNKESDYYFLINTYNYSTNETVWYLKFGLESINKNVMAVGNTSGDVMLFNLNLDDNEDANDFDYFYNNEPSHQIKCGDTVIRSIYFDRDSNYVIIGNNHGQMFLTEIENK